MHLPTLKQPATLLLFGLGLALMLAQPALAEKPWLGIYMQNVTGDLAEAFNLAVVRGVLVDDVIEDSPAEKAGLKHGDVIIAWGDQNVDDAEELTLLVGNSKIGDAVKLLVVRDGAEKDFGVVIGERDDDYRYSDHEGRPMLELFQPRTSSGIGVSLQSLTGDLGEYFGVEDGEGALITEVHDDSPAEAAGLKAGDVIVAVDGEKVDNPSEVSRLIGAHEVGDETTLTIVRERSETKLVVKVDEIESFGDYGHDKLPRMYFFDRYHNMPDFHWFEKDDNDDEELEQKLETLQRNLREMEKKLKQLEDRLD